MFAEERRRGDGIDFTLIVTPNDTHFAIARDALAAGFDIMSDKPATTTLEEAIALGAMIRESGRAYTLTYTYTGYPMVREARALVAASAFGRVRKVVVEYYQGWLSDPVEQAGNRQAEWRTDPARSGIGGCIADIGVHAFNLAEFVCGDRVVELRADLRKVVGGRLLDDDATVLVRFSEGAGGIIAASQIATGDRNGLRLRVWGEKGGLDWNHERADLLTINWANGTTELRHAGSGGLSASSSAASRLPAGHPEGFIEALANIYMDFARKIRGEPSPELQTIDDGIRSMAFVAGAVANSNQNAAWREV
jgi:predicted dehydrogenase